MKKIIDQTEKKLIRNTKIYKLNLIHFFTFLLPKNVKDEIK